ncbi:hypothetical protein RHSIM_Rhsim13G0216300 [Rhododendron simsii]|uniref:PGG domain-containing protein n=1 Tax=Rhododendron simsii TaxID=118357 RepID=A0A834FXU9_RHOSS|nr:hypothetical protein RHSIM_Rhsim13G0216300 [Rhododendron simsii]
MCLAITSMALTYSFSITVVTPKWERTALSRTIEVAVVVWCGVTAIVLLVHVIRTIASIVGKKKSRDKAVRRLKRLGSDQRWRRLLVALISVALQRREEPPSDTLKEFLNSLAEDENKEVQDLFETYRRDNGVLDDWTPIVDALCATYGDFSASSLLISPRTKMLYIMTVCFEMQFAFDCLEVVVCAHISLQANIPSNSAHLVEEFVKKLNLLDSLPASVTRQQGENDSILKQEITLKKKNNARRHLKECFKVALELKGQIAGESLFQFEEREADLEASAVLLICGGRDQCRRRLLVALITIALQRREVVQNDVDRVGAEDAIDPKWLAKKRTALIIVAVLLATMAFQAGVTPPGGIWPDNNGHRGGQAVMAYNYPHLYKYFLRSNTVGFVASLSTILLLISELPFNKRRYVWALVAIMCLAITSMALTYSFSITVVTPKWERTALSRTIEVAVVVWCSVTAIVLLVHAIRTIASIVGKKKSRDKAVRRLKRLGISFGR